MFVFKWSKLVFFDQFRFEFASVGKCLKELLVNEMGGSGNVVNYSVKTAKCRLLDCIIFVINKFEEGMNQIADDFKGCIFRAEVFV